jgi:hypothetical protein
VASVGLADARAIVFDNGAQPLRVTLQAAWGSSFA